MKNLKGVVGGYASKVQRSEVCCNNTALMNSWMFPTPNASGPCCGDLSSKPPFFIPVNTTDNFIETDKYSFDLPLCRDGISITIVNRINNIIDPLENIDLRIIIDGNGFLLTNNGSNTFTIYQGSNIVFQINSNQSGDYYCHDAEIDIINNTCGVSYINAAKLSINYDVNCALCSVYIPNVVTFDRLVNVFQITNTLPVSFDYNFYNIVANTPNSCFNLGVWTTANPNVQIDPDFYLVEDGITNPQAITLNPGQTMWIVAWIHTPCDIDADYDIFTQYLYQPCGLGIDFSWNVRFSP